MSSMRLLHAVENLSRDAGGLPIVVAELAVHLEEAGPAVSAEILAPAVPPDQQSVDISSGVTRLTATSTLLGGGSMPGLLKEKHSAAPYSLIHQHGIWAPLPVGAGSFAKHQGLPLVCSPHGMLEAWALHHHAAKKRVAWLLYQKRNLRGADVLHAASEPEAVQIRNVGFEQPIAVIPHGIAPAPSEPLDPEAVEASKPKRQALFLSRIHPKKGIDMLLRAWKELAPAEWELVIAGNDQGGHRHALETLARRLGIAADVRFIGPVFGKEKDTAFRRSDLFVLPTHSENFGIVVAEAMQYGLPVLTTTGTPWKKVADNGCGWWVDPETGSIGSVLEKALQMSDAGRKEMGRRGIEVVEAEHRWPALVDRYLELYRWLTEAGPAPDWITTP